MEFSSILIELKLKKNERNLIQFEIELNSSFALNLNIQMSHSVEFSSTLIESNSFLFNISTEKSPFLV